MVSAGFHRGMVTVSIPMWPSGLATELVRKYSGMFPEEVSRSTDGKDLGAAVAERHRQLVFELNRSGVYRDMKSTLKEAMIALAKEKISKEDVRDELMPVYGDLYARVLDGVHDVLHELLHDRPPTRDAKAIKSEAEFLLQLTTECELSGDMARAEALQQERSDRSNFTFEHKRATPLKFHWEQLREECGNDDRCELQMYPCRLLLDDSPESWYCYALFCMRSGNHAGAEEGLRKALLVDPSHLRCLLALACLMWYKGVNTDTMYMEDAIAV
jgi:hypothetical protein